MAARKARRGLWTAAAYQVQHADSPAELVHYRATFQLVEGQVVRAAQARGGAVYLNFAGDWRKALSVALQRKDASLLGVFARDVKGLEGKTVRVRGWVEQRERGPLIDLSVAGDLAVIEGRHDSVHSPAPRRRSRLREGREPPLQEPEAKPPGLVETGR